MIVKRILIYRTLVVVVYAAAAVRLLRFLDSTVLHPFELEKKSLGLAFKSSTIIEFKFTEVFPLIMIGRQPGQRYNFYRNANVWLSHQPF